MASIPPPGCDPAIANNLTPGPNYNNCTNTAVTTSTNQPSGLATATHTVLLAAAFTSPTVACPNGVPNCTKFSNPLLANNIIWQNRTFHITTGVNPIPGAQTVVTLAPMVNQASSGACPTGASYWDIGIYGDVAPGRSATPGSGYVLNPLYSIVGDPGYDAGANPGHNNPNQVRTRGVGVVKQACNGSRVPPEIAANVCTSTANAPGCAQNGNPQGGITVPTGVPDVNPFYPVFSLNPAATTDEGNNFINMFFGPLSMTNSAALAGTPGFGVPLSNYAVVQTSPAVNGVLRGPNSTFSLAPSTDFYGNPRPAPARLNTITIGAVEFASAANFLVQPASLTFTSSMTVTSAAQSVVVSNTGNTTLTIAGGGISFTGANASQFQQTSTGCGTLAPGATCTINVTFTPTGLTTPNPRTAILNVNIGNGSPQAIALTGNIVAPTVTLSTPPAFPNQTVTTTSAAQTATLTNTGTVQLSAINITINPTGEFTQTNTCGNTLAAGPGTSCTINVTFRPTATGTRTATLSVNGAGLAAPVTAALTGTGIAGSTSATRAPNALSFPGQNVGTTSTTAQTVTVTNPGGGGALLNIGTSITGANAADFVRPTGTAGGTCGTTLAAGANCTINITITPSAAGARSATLTITSSATLPTVALSGTGTQAVVAFALPTQPTGLVTGAADRTPKNGTITVNNTGNGPLTITAPPTLLQQSGTGAFTINPSTTCTTNAVVAAGSSCTISIHYVPPTAPASVASTVRVRITDYGTGNGTTTTTQTTPTPPATISAN
jgi:hypothetical protein